MFKQTLQKNVFVFSGAKTYTQLKELTTLLLDDKGEFKSWSNFKSDALKIHKTYNVNYLSAEYNHAVNSAQMASQWQHWEKDGDRYYLQYRIRGVNTRPSHAAMENITLPMSDPFWDKYLPPNDWNCFCSAKQVLKQLNTPSNSKEALSFGEKATTRIGKDGNNKAEMFRFNPGKQKAIFPQHHPYFIQAKGIQSTILTMFNSSLNDVKRAFKSYNSYDENWTKAGFNNKTGGYNVYHKKHQFTKKGGEMEKAAGNDLMNKNGKQVEFLDESATTKQPDLKFDKQTWDVKWIDETKSISTIRKAMMEAASKADNVLFYFPNTNKKDLVLNALDREKGHLSKINKLKKLPGVSYIDKEGILKELWKKQ